MKPKDVLLERWIDILARKGDAPAIFNTRGEVVRTFRQIERNLESKIDDYVQPGGVFPVQIGNHEDWPSILIACLRTQRIVLPLDESLTKQQADAAISIAEKSSDLHWNENPPVLFKLTSGTTAAPRLIRFRSEQLLADCDQICETMEISDVDLNFGVIPVSHSYGFSNLLAPLIARGVPMVLSRDRTPRAVLDDLARTNATVFPGMPVFYQAFCEMEKVPALPKLRLCISAGAPLPLAVAKKFREKFGLAIHSFYGASECGGICYDREAKLEIEGFVGAPMKDVDLEMIDSTSEASQVRVRSAAAGDGYFPEVDEEKLGNGFFTPDDLLAREDDGFKIVGRVSDLINVAGKKVSPAEIEEILLKLPGVRQAVAFGRQSALRNEEVAVCVVGDVDLTENKLLESCRKSLSTWQVPKRIFVVDSIPTNERGKINRRELAKRFRG
jgi:long-chain acyl-CoA synthetase